MATRFGALICIVVLLWPAAASANVGTTAHSGMQGSFRVAADDAPSDKNTLDDRVVSARAANSLASPDTGTGTPVASGKGRAGNLMRSAVMADGETMFPLDGVPVIAALVGGEGADLELRSAAAPSPKVIVMDRQMDDPPMTPPRPAHVLLMCLAIGCALILYGRRHANIGRAFYDARATQARLVCYWRKCAQYVWAAVFMWYFWYADQVSWTHEWQATDHHVLWFLAELAAVLLAQYSIDTWFSCRDDDQPRSGGDFGLSLLWSAFQKRPNSHLEDFWAFGWREEVSSVAPVDTVEAELSTSHSSISEVEPSELQSSVT